MCLGEVLGRLTNPGAKKSPQKTPDPVGTESAVSSTPVTTDKKKTVEEKKPTTPTTQANTSSSTSMTDTGINY